MATLHALGKSEDPIKTFENELKAYFGVKHCFLVSSGKAALALILQSLRDLFPEKNKVLVPAFTCFSVPAAIKRAGLEIELCDIDLESLDFDQKTLSNLANNEPFRNDLLCVIPTHLFGLPAKVEFCRNIFSDDVVVIEDAAQAMGNSEGGKKLGTIGDIGFFSLGRGKALSTIEGGVIITNRDDIALALKKKIVSLPGHNAIEKIQLLFKASITNFLQNPHLFWLPKSLPFLHLGETIYNPDFAIKKLSSLHARLAHDWQTNLSKYQNIRNAKVSLFINFTSAESRGVSFPWPTVTQPLIRLPVLAESSDMRHGFVNTASGQGLGVMPVYPTPINEIEELRHTFDGQDYPKAKILSNQLITIPTHQYMQKRDYRRIQSLLNGKAQQ